MSKFIGSDLVGSLFVVAREVVSLERPQGKLSYDTRASLDISHCHPNTYKFSPQVSLNLIAISDRPPYLNLPIF